MGSMSRDTSKGQLVPLIFGQDAVAATQTDVQLPAAVGEASQANDGYVMPFNGDVVAMTFDLSAAGSAGQLTIGATKGGAEWADTTKVITTAQTGAYHFARGKHRFKKGDRIGAELTASGTWNGTTADLAVVIWVLLEMEGI